MQLEHLKGELEKNGFVKIPSNVEQISLFYRVEEDTAVGICLMDDRGQTLGDGGLFEAVMERTEALLKTKAKDSRALGLIVTEHMEREKNRGDARHAVWLIDTSLGQRIVFENQPGRFFGVERIVDGVLEQGDGGADGAGRQKRTERADGTGREKGAYAPWDAKPWSRYLFSSNTVIVVVNVLAFLWMSLASESGDAWLYRHGAIHVASFLQDPQWWRLLASAFLHFSFSHLFGNMVVLWYIGNFVEQQIGWWRYLLLYGTVAVGANLLSLGWYWYSHDWNVLTAGASGAIFGVVGMLLYMVIRERGRVQGVTLQQMVLMVIFTLYTGLANSGVNNSAHVGGLLVGFLCGLIFYRGPVRGGGRRALAGRQ